LVVQVSKKEKLGISTAINLFLVDLYRDGRYFTLGIVGNKEAIKIQLQLQCQDVTHVRTIPKRNKDKYTGDREWLGFRIVYCKYTCDITRKTQINNMKEVDKDGYYVKAVHDSPSIDPNNVTGVHMLSDIGSTEVEN